MIKLTYKIFVGLPRKIYFYSLKFYREILLPQFPNILRLSSYPYISGDSFRKFSDHVLDEGKEINIKKIKKGDIVFVQSDFIDEYFMKYNSNISEEHILITQNHFYPISEEYIKKIGDNLLCWFAQNLDIKNETEKLKAIPLGIENIRDYKNGVTSHFESKEIKANINSKPNLVLSSFAPHTNIEKRGNIAEIVKNINYIDISVSPNHKEYVRNLSSYKFNICPSGAGIDTHRFWESLIVKTIPIVLRNNVITHFLNHKIPMVVLNDWNELYEIHKEDLNKLYDDFSHQLLNDNYIWFDYWKQLIEEKKR